VLNSGTGEIGWIEEGASTEEAKFQELAFCPSLVRGLAFYGKYAFVGLSKPRYERFEGLALDRKLAETDSELWCGVQIVDLDTGACVHWFRIDGRSESSTISVLCPAWCGPWRSASPASRFSA
jgi:uncharacterized protein (TIGR03032 family)